MPSPQPRPHQRPSLPFWFLTSLWLLVHLAALWWAYLRLSQAAQDYTPPPPPPVGTGAR